MKAQHIVSVSGGKDSTATYLLALERLQGNYRAVFADTGNEHPATYEFVARLHERTGGPKVETVRADFMRLMAGKAKFIAEKWPQAGVPQERVDRALELLKPSGNPYLDLCLWKGLFPSRKAQFCTAELKVLPITEQVILPALRRGPVLQWLGIRADESSNRSKQPRYNRDDSGSYLWRPIFKWTVDDVWAMHRKHGLAPNPLYAQGMGRVGCMPCVNCSKGELREIADRFPEQIERIEQWEKIVSEASKRGASSFFATAIDPMNEAGEAAHVGIRSAVEWSRTTRGGRQYGMFFDQQTGGGCNSDLGLCERASA